MYVSVNMCKMQIYVYNLFLIYIEQWVEGYFNYYKFLSLFFFCFKLILQCFMINVFKCDSVWKDFQINEMLKNEDIQNKLCDLNIMKG